MDAVKPDTDTVTDDAAERTRMARMADIRAWLANHVARYEERIKQAKEAQEIELAQIATNRTFRCAQHYEDMRDLREQAQAVKDRTKQSIAADQRLITAARAAMKEIEG